jgi:hypothetical protein
MPIKEITRADLLDFDEYVAVRKNRKSLVSSLKKNRRISVGPDATFYFESFDTMLHQIQEMLYIERGGEDQIEDELNAYNSLIPNGHELIATLMFEIDNAERRAEFLARLGGVENKIKIVLNDDVIDGVPELDIERTNESGKTSSIHFIHFPFNQDQSKKFKDLETSVKLGIDHEGYGHMALIPKISQEALSKDLD